MSHNESTPLTVFTEAEYHADPKRVVSHAIATGRAIVTRADGTIRVVMSVPPAEPAVAKP